jgi:hypothetical protein
MNGVLVANVSSDQLDLFGNVPSLSLCSIQTWYMV